MSVIVKIESTITKAELEKYIDQRKQEMYDIATKHGYSAPETVAISQQIDGLLNLYHNMS